MKRIRKSMKILITLLAVFAVAVAGVVTTILINNSKGKKPGDDGSSGYALTASQKLLVSEINNKLSTSVSKNKVDLISFSQSIFDIDDVDYFDESIIWSYDNIKGAIGNYSEAYDVYILDEAGQPTEFLTCLNSSNLTKPVSENIVVGDKYNGHTINYPYIYRVEKNHVVLCNRYTEAVAGTSGYRTIQEYCIYSVENHEIKYNATFECVVDDSGNLSSRDGDKFRIVFGGEFFAVLRKSSGDYNYECFEYLTNYSNYEPYKYFIAENDIDDISVEINGESLTANSNIKVNYTAGVGFSGVKTADNYTYYRFNGAQIKQNDTVSSANDAKSEKQGENYYTYSYIFSMSGNSDKTIDLGEYHKISDVVYAGNNYFAVFMQKVDANHALVDGGQIVYYDYNLNVVAKYLANSADSIIRYSDGTSVLTQEGMLSGKNEIELKSTYSFSTNGYTLNSVLPSGNFTLKDSSDQMKIYNFNMGEVISVYIDSFDASIDDNCFIFSSYGDMYLFDDVNDTYSKVSFSSSILNEKSRLFLVSVTDEEGNETYTLYEGSTVKESGILDYFVSSNDKYITYIKANGTTVSYYFSDNATASDIVVDKNKITYTSSSYVSESYGDDEVENYGAIVGYIGYHEGHDFVEYDGHNQDYNYDDTCMYMNANEDGYLLYRVTHCIQDGYYDSVNYSNYLELGYSLYNYNSNYGNSAKETSLSSNGTNHVPLRIYYTITIDDGVPRLDNIIFGHSFILAREVASNYSTYSGYLSLGGKSYYMNQTASYPADFMSGNSILVYNSSTGSYDDARGYPLSMSASDFSYDKKATNGNYSYYYSGENYRGNNLSKSEFYLVKGISYKDALGNLYNSNVEVYGDSLKVTFYFLYKELAWTGTDTNDKYSASFDRCTWGCNKLEDCWIGNPNTKPTTTDNNYKSKLYYKTAVVGISDENFNYTDIVSKYSNYTSDFVTTEDAEELKSKSVSVNYFGSTGKGYGGSTLSIALSGKTYYSSDYTNLYLGKDVKLDIVGGRLVGVTTLNNSTRADTLTSNFYDRYGSYKSDAIEFRANDGSGGYNKNDVCDDANVANQYKYLTYSSSSSSASSYVFGIHNKKYIYSSGNLNKIRYVICVYEPQTYSVEVDYNISGEANSVENEIDYLKNYASIDFKDEYNTVLYGTTWVYKNPTDDGGFNNYDNSKNDKYVPENFTDSSTRTVSATRKSSTTVYEEKLEDNSRRTWIYSYVKIYGIKYYFNKRQTGQTAIYNRVEDFQAYTSAEQLTSYSDSYGYYDDSREYNKYSSGATQIYLYRTRDDTTNKTLTYYIENDYIQKRTANYDGYYYYDNGQLKVDDADISYLITETFTFTSIQQMDFNAAPIHCHYNFKNWTVYLGDGNTKTVSAQSTLNNRVKNVSSGWNLFGDVVDGNNAYYSNWNVAEVGTGGKINWKTNDDRTPIKIVANWEPKECTIEAILWTQTSAQDPHYSLKFELKDGAYSITDTYNIAANSLTPLIYKGDTDIDKKDGVWDGKMDTVKFTYSQGATFYNLITTGVMSSYWDNNVIARNINCTFAGWAYKDRSTGEYFSLDEEYITEAQKLLNIKEYIGDTTQITVYAYYTPSLYNISFDLYPMGGALKDDTYKNFADGATSTLVNNESVRAYYEYIEFSTSARGANAGRLEKIFNTKTGGLEFDLDGLVYRSGGALFDTFYCGDDLQIVINTSKEYYLSEFVIDNLIFYDPYTSKLDLYSVKFTYYKNEEGVWGWKANVSREYNKATYEISVVSQDGSYSFTLGLGGQEGNVISILPGGSTGSGSSWKILVNSLANASETFDYDKQYTTGKKGFNIKTYLSTYALENEEVEITCSNDEKDLVGSFNSSLLISSQPISDAEGNLNNGSSGMNAYIWIGSTRYLFSATAWTGTFPSGYYKLYANGGTTALVNTTYTYEEFIDQELVNAGDLYVYYDDVDKLVYYPVELTKITNYKSVGVEYTGLGAAVYNVFVRINGLRYYLAYNYDWSSDSGKDIRELTVGKVYYLLSEYRAPEKSGKFYSKNENFAESLVKDECFKKTAYFYAKAINENTLQYYDGTETAKSGSSEDSDPIRINYNNTRILAIDPEQERNYLSDSPSSYQQSQNSYELKFYMSKLTISNTIFAFNQITRDVIVDDTDKAKKYYGNLKMNVDDSASGNIVSLTDRINKEISFLGKTYVIHDAYMLTIPNEVGFDDTAKTYYLYLGRTIGGYTKYFLIYDENSSSINSLQNVFKIKIEFKLFETNIKINLKDEDIYDSYYYGKDGEVRENGDYSIEQNTSLLGNQPTKVTHSTALSTNYELYTESLLGYIDGRSLNLYENDKWALDEFKFYRTDLTYSGVVWNSYASNLPYNTTVLGISTSSGYIVDSVKVYVGSGDDKIPVMSFEIDTASSFENIYSSVNGSYSYLTIDGDTIQSKIEYVVKFDAINDTDQEEHFDTNFGYVLGDSRIIGSSKQGLYYTNSRNAGWTYGSKNTYSFDQLYFLISGMYENITIDIETTTYTEFMFESGEGANNPLLLDANSITLTEGQKYADISLEDTLLSINTRVLTSFDSYQGHPLYDSEASYISKSIDDIKVMVGDELSGYHEDEDSCIYILRYYPTDLGTNKISSGTIRLIFYGTGSYVNAGIDVMAVTESRSAYFTNARYYNEKTSEFNSTSTKEYDFFRRLLSFSGRTQDDKKITASYNLEISNHDKTNKMIYWQTNDLIAEYSSSFKNMVCFTSILHDVYKPSAESNYKSFAVMKVFTNYINAETSSYLYNNNLTSEFNQALNPNTFGTLSYNKGTKSSILYQNSKGNSVGSATSVKYKYDFNGSFLTIHNGSTYKQYQLDNKNKTKSWFNDVVLSNIEFNSYEDKPDIYRTWVNREADGTSQLTKQQTAGLDFGWTYYDIAGYYLKYIMVYTEDFNDAGLLGSASYHIIDIQNILSSVTLDNSRDSSKPIAIVTIKPNEDANNIQKFYYTFNIYYITDTSTGIGKFVFKPVAYKYELDNNGNIKTDIYGNPIIELDEDGNPVIDIVNSLSILSNGIKVSFVSEASTYKIDYVMYDYDASSKISTLDTLQIKQIGTSSWSRYNEFSAVKTQTFYYDSIFKLEYTHKMDGYTFIGWGEEKYYSNGSFVSRFTNGNGTDNAPEWNSSSTWFDLTQYFVQEGMSGEQCAKWFYNLYSIYTSSAVPASEFYTNGAYFLTDTGYSDSTNGLSQNYNFYSSHVALFNKNIGYAKSPTSKQWTENYNNVINLFGIFKANTYSIEFNVNNYYGDNYYLSYTGDDWYTTEFVGDKIGFRTKKTIASETTYTSYIAYITFDTNEWYYSVSNDNYVKLKYSANQRIVDGANTLIDIISMAKDEYNLSALTIDMFGYSWLGWYFTRANNINQGGSLQATVNLAFSSTYLRQRNSSLGEKSLPTFNKTFMNTLNLSNSITDFDENSNMQFYYYGQHKVLDSLSETDGYVYFYDYGMKNGLNGNYGGVEISDASGVGIIPVSLQYIQCGDYLNVYSLTSGKPSYETNLSAKPVVFSYYDTCFNKNVYRVSRSDENYIVSLSKSLENTRHITLFALWSQNKYQTIFDNVDGYDNYQTQLNNTTTTSIDPYGSTFINSSTLLTSYSSLQSAYGGEYYYFNDQVSDSNKLQTYLSDITPSRLGYDFVGWSFSHIIEGSYKLNNKYYNEGYASIINTPSNYLYLCKETLAQYAVLSNIDENGRNNDANYAYRSTILMLDGNRNKDGSSRTGNNTWILNNANSGECLGDTEIHAVNGSESTHRYIYLYPVWKPQTFSINISLNIAKQELLNLYEKDSSFALGLYDSLTRKNNSYTYTTNGVYTGITTKNYIYDSSDTNNYFNDIVANLCYEIEFDQSFDTATVNFNGKQYSLASFFGTSTGYFFAGLMLSDTNKYSLYGSTSNVDQMVTKNSYAHILTLYGLESHASEYISWMNGYMDNADRWLNSGILCDDEEVWDFDNSKLEYMYYTGLFGAKGVESLDLTTYQYLHRTSAQNNGNLGSTNDYNSLVTGSTPSVSTATSSNFGYLSMPSYYRSGKSAGSEGKFPIMSEIVDGQTYLFVLINNVKYYVVYYIGGSYTFSDVITADRTFLYYNEKDENGIVLNKYVIRFDDKGNAYYVDDTYDNRNVLSDARSLKIALYTGRTNTLYLKAGSFVSYSDADKNGSLINLTGKSVGGVISSYITTVLKNDSFREFTLYCAWSQNVEWTVTVRNENGYGGNSDSYNQGLAGWAQISTNIPAEPSNGGISSGYLTKKVETIDLDDTERRVSIQIEKRNWYGDVDFSFIPYYSGRYLSEMTFKFNSFSETTAGNVSTFKLVENTLTIYFAWDNVNLRLNVSKVTLNGSEVINGYTLSTYKTDYASLSLKTGANSVVSLLDKDSLSNINFKLYQRDDYGDNREDVNKVTLSMKNLMTSVDISCKYSIQTYQVEVYKVFGDSITSSGKTNFANISAMHASSNYDPENRKVFGEPYISSASFNNTIMSTISVDCANNVLTYNVPYGYVISRGDTTSASPINFGGKDYVFGNKHTYKNGATMNYVSQVNGALGSIGQELSGYTFNNWYTIASENGGVTLSTYVEKMTTENMTIYGYYINSDKTFKVLFYYWDNESQQYLQYTNNASEYTYEGAHQGSYVNKVLSTTQSGTETDNYDYVITQLPSPTIAPWYGDSKKQFVGYVYFTSSILSDLTAKERNYEYNSLEYRAANSYTATKGDIYSAKGSWTNAITGLTISDLFNERITVNNNKYFTTRTSINGVAVDVLDSVRVNLKLSIGGSSLTVIKDLKMLNTSSRFLNGGYVYAIPIYEEMELSIDAVYARDSSIDDCDNIYFTLTSNSNMIKSNVFETNKYYTIYYNPIDLRFAITTNNNLTIAELTTNATINKSSSVLLTSSDVKNSQYKGMKYYSFTKLLMGGGDDVNDNSTLNILQSYGLLELNNYIKGQSFYLTAYYVKDSSVAFYKSNSIRIEATSKSISVTGSGLSSTRAVPNLYASPLDISLTTNDSQYIAKDSLYETYESASDYIDYNVTDKNERENRKLLVYIALQMSKIKKFNRILECKLANEEGNYEYYYGYVSDKSTYYENSTSANYIKFEDSPSNPDYGKNYVNIKDVIVNLNHYINGATIEEMYTNDFGIIRMIYAMAYYYKYKMYPRTYANCLLDDTNEKKDSRFENFDFTKFNTDMWSSYWSIAKTFNTTSIIDDNGDYVYELNDSFAKGIKNLYARNEDRLNQSNQYMRSALDYSSVLNTITTKNIETYIKPGDILKDNRSSNSYTIIDVLNKANNASVYYTKKNVTLGMFLCANKDKVMFLSGATVYTITREVYEDRKLQSNYTYEHFKRVGDGANYTPKLTFDNLALVDDSGTKRAPLCIYSDYGDTRSLKYANNYLSLNMGINTVIYNTGSYIYIKYGSGGYRLDYYSGYSKFTFTYGGVDMSTLDALEVNKFYYAGSYDSEWEFTNAGNSSKLQNLRDWAIATIDATESSKNTYYATQAEKDLRTIGAKKYGLEKANAWIDTRATTLAKNNIASSYKTDLSSAQSAKSTAWTNWKNAEQDLSAAEQAYKDDPTDANKTTLEAKQKAEEAAETAYNNAVTTATEKQSAYDAEITRLKNTIYTAQVTDTRNETYLYDDSINVSNTFSTSDWDYWYNYYALQAYNNMLDSYKTQYRFRAIAKLMSEQTTYLYEPDVDDYIMTLKVVNSIGITFKAYQYSVGNYFYVLRSSTATTNARDNYYSDAWDLPPLKWICSSRFDKENGYSSVGYLTSVSSSDFYKDYFNKWLKNNHYSEYSSGRYRFNSLSFYGSSSTMTVKFYSSLERKTKTYTITGNFVDALVVSSGWDGGNYWIVSSDSQTRAYIFTCYQSFF